MTNLVQNKVYDKYVIIIICTLLYICTIMKHKGEYLITKFTIANAHIKYI